MVEMKPYKNIDEYIQNFPPSTQEILQKIRRVMHGVVPEAEEVISYGIPTFKLKGKPVAYFAGYEKHVSVYPVPAGDEVFQKEIAPYRKGKGTLQFPLDKPIPYDLIEKVVKLLLKERLGR
ncbi:MAG: iron chaperone [Candidatus Saccharimonadales bacterium]